ncbi:anti-phage dCTP deaminase [Pannonibacter phragmitetus]|uniref:anti-phage dCTP deaminase n=1 Tax=Pannonibacter phragmitetus TaxID=121719 RepID=UPI0009E4FCFE|nr:anti-phage dCTP deaminase [Pannonibacter phragmitetus]
MAIKISRIEQPNLVVGIVAPIGVDIPAAITALTDNFKRHKYNVVCIKMTDSFNYVQLRGVETKENTTLERYESYIKFGNSLRSAVDDNAILAAMAVWDIFAKREGHKDKTVFIVHQFKREEEIELFRKVYGRMFFQISIFSSGIKRREVIASKIADDNNSVVHRKFLNLADKLLDVDENEIDAPHGQRVNDVFHLADYIMNVDAAESLEKQAQRFVDLAFGDNSISPSKAEYGMYFAKAAALRSLDLSRQVGAAIFSRNHEVITLGCNEVPKGGGGAYWEGESVEDARDYKKKEDLNEKKKKFNIFDLIDKMRNEGYLRDDVSNAEIINNEIIKKSEIMNVLEYGRIVHAEMAAITDAARLGRSVKNSVLYCTTFPCHMCAKHIVASGIEKVIFLEPYPKSNAFDLHSDAISIDGLESQSYINNKKSCFEHFYGVSPKRFRDFFEKSKRKTNGKFNKWMKGEAKPIYDMIVPIWEVLEEMVVSQYYSEVMTKFPDIFKVEFLRLVSDKLASQPAQRRHGVEAGGVAGGEEAEDDADQG